MWRKSTAAYRSASDAPFLRPVAAYSQRDLAPPLISVPQNLRWILPTYLTKLLVFTELFRLSFVKSLILALGGLH
jgi:hypothetical protein